MGNFFSPKKVVSLLLFKIKGNFTYQKSKRPGQVTSRKSTSLKISTSSEKGKIKIKAILPSTKGI